MSNSLIRDALILTGFSIAACVAVINRHAIYEYTGLVPSADGTETTQTPPLLKKFSFLSRKNTQPQELAVKNINIPNGSVVTISKNPRDGQFWTDARVDSGIVHFLVDTGASSVALTLEDARKAGIRDRELTYNVPISTAGGRNMAASITIGTLSVGGITLRNVDAIVVPKGLHVSLLGMTYLGQLQKVEASSDTLTLRF